MVDITNGRSAEVDQNDCLTMLLFNGIYLRLQYLSNSNRLSDRKDVAAGKYVW